MSDKTIMDIGKFFFWISFLLGNLCLFGYLITKQDCFAAGGYLLLVFASVANLLAILFLFVYGIANKNKFSICIKAIGIISINIPLAFFYALIGISII